MLNILLEKIKNLPDLCLTTMEFNCLVEILRQRITTEKYTETPFATFRRIIKEKKTNNELIDIRPEKIEETRSYLFHLDKANTILLLWGKSIYEESKQVLKKDIGGEEFNDITWSLLQKEKFDSQLIQNKLSIALRIVSGETECYLVSLFISIGAKDNAPNYSEKKALKNLEGVIKNIDDRETALKNLLNTFSDYKKYLLKLMIDKLATTYQRLASSNDNPIIDQNDKDDQFVEMLRKETQQKDELKQQLIGADKDLELINLVEDYRIVKNIYYTLTQEKHSTKEKLACCYQQINEYKERLEKNVYFKSSWEIIAPYIPGSKTLKQAAEILRLEKLSLLWPNKQQALIGTLTKFANIASTTSEPKQVLQEEKNNTPTP